MFNPLQTHLQVGESNVAMYTQHLEVSHSPAHSSLHPSALGQRLVNVDVLTQLVTVYGGLTRPHGLGVLVSKTYAPWAGMWLPVEHVAATHRPWLYEPQK